MKFGLAKRVAICSAVAVLYGCAASSAIVVGHTRPPIAADQVRVYLTPPAKYEEIAVLESSSKNSWAVSDQGKIDIVVARMKEEAAKLGANGIILRSSGDQYAGSVGVVPTGNPSMFATAGVFHKAGAGVAIYVPD